MLRFLRNLILLLIAAAMAAGGIFLYSSKDPAYEIQAMLYGSRYTQYDGEITDASTKLGVDPMLVKALIWRESAFYPDKIGGSGERGLMQVGEAAARDWVKSTKTETFVPTDLFDPHTNITIGTWYLKQALDHWQTRDDPVPFALAEYNAGRSRVDRWLGATSLGEKAKAEDFVQAIDFPSTKRYVEDIVQRFRYYQGRGKM